ncbi:uncharacterized protein BYT42DRAFT_578933 [Radiomyces spectabilis]|uniref:uncharacterized protein n=1 Tax=Radiomyces spectabilis TaxID=64574 RepID=UPI0022205AB8|nr:uncharacterized protein BYT42DRAFT_578933 [Radiomyces spectabilis]KAI8373017.1 hypothetical protein BYT42DRAFT_578933 [Radiomyces spectabilis]
MTLCPISPFFQTECWSIIGQTAILASAGGPPSKPATLWVKRLILRLHTELDPAPSTDCSLTPCETAGKSYVCCPSKK